MILVRLTVLFKLTYKSLLNRKITFIFSVISIAISVFLLLGIQKSVKISKHHFINTINSTDIIVAAPNGSLDILLKTIFHISEPLKEISYDSYEKISNFEEVKWSVPLSLGDSFHGFDVLSTNSDYFKYYRYATDKQLFFKDGRNFDDFFDVVIGSEVAKKLDLKLGDTIHISHGSAKEHHTHKNRNFNVAGILRRSFTPNDTTVFIQLKADEAIHLEWQTNHFVDMHISDERLKNMRVKPKHISAILIGLHNPADILSVEDKINHLKSENLKAIIPAKALSKLFKLMQNSQNILTLISTALFFTALLTMLSSMFSSLNERKREVAILRSIGANSKVIFQLFMIESAITVLSAIMLGVIVLDIFMLILSFYVGVEFSYMLSLQELLLLSTLFVVGLLSSLLPAIKSYKGSLKDGLTVKS